MKRIWFAVGLVLLFVTIDVLPAITPDPEKPLPASKGKWFYVGGTGPGNYSSIQAAINDSADGDTVFVYAASSPYYENLIVNTSITLLGEHDIYYWFDWDDGTNSGWLGPYPSGETVTETHKWNTAGVFYVQVKAKDSAGDTAT